MTIGYGMRTQMALASSFRVLLLRHPLCQLQPSQPPIHLTTLNPYPFHISAAAPRTNLLAVVPPADAVGAAPTGPIADPDLAAAPTSPDVVSAPALAATSAPAPAAATAADAIALAVKHAVAVPNNAVCPAAQSCALNDLTLSLHDAPLSRRLRQILPHIATYATTMNAV